MADWRPDWRDEAAYVIDEEDQNQWRWEFVRRLDEYTCDYLAAVYRSVLGGSPEFLQAGGAVAMPSSNRNPGCLEKYGMKFILDPAASRPLPGQYVWRLPKLVGFANENRQKEWKDGGKQLVLFDLNAPIAPQLKQIRGQLERFQKYIVGDVVGQREHRKKWRNYLRVLDAKHSGTSHVEIAKVLHLQPANLSEGYDPERLVSGIRDQAEIVQLRFKNSA